MRTPTEPYGAVMLEFACAHSNLRTTDTDGYQLSMTMPPGNDVTLAP